MKNIVWGLGLVILSTIAKPLVAQEVRINDNFVVESDGTVRYDSVATVWDDIRITLHSRGTATSPTFSILVGGLYAYSFEGTKDQSLFFEIQLPHSWKEGSTIYPHVHWTSQGSDTRQVTWGLEYCWVNTGESSNSTTTITSSVIPNGPYVHNINNIGSGIDGTGKRISSILLCRVFRAGVNDPNTDNCFLIAFDVHYQLDTAGSRDILTK